MLSLLFHNNNVSQLIRKIMFLKNTHKWHKICLTGILIQTPTYYNFTYTIHVHYTRTRGTDTYSRHHVLHIHRLFRIVHPFQSLMGPTFHGDKLYTCIIQYISFLVLIQLGVCLTIKYKYTVHVFGILSTIFIQILSYFASITLRNFTILLNLKFGFKPYWIPCGIHSWKCSAT